MLGVSAVTAVITAPTAALLVVLLKLIQWRRIAQLQRRYTTLPAELEQ
jgi:hypothetical protein